MSLRCSAHKELETHRLQVEVPVLIQDSAAHTSSCDDAELELELPELVD